MDIAQIVSANIKRYRAKEGLTQEKLAERAGLHRTYIGGIEQKRINVSIKNLEKIANALGVTPALLVFDSKSAAPKESESVQYAICSWENGEMNAMPIEVKHEDLTVQVVHSLMKQGLAGEELAQAYDRLCSELEGLFSEDGRADGSQGTESLTKDAKRNRGF